MSKMIAPLEVGICCEDVDRLVSFYVDILSAKLIGIAEVSAEKALEAGVGASGFRIARIELPTGERLKFLHPRTPPRVEEPSGIILEKRNTAYLTFVVDDMAEIIRRLPAAGGTFISSSDPVDIRPGVSVLLAFDPEQNLVEFVCYADLSSYRPELGGTLVAGEKR